MKKEIWKVIEDFPNYEVSNKGQVRNKITGLILKPTLDKTTGYLKVNLQKNNKGNTRTMHRLVAEAFLNKPDNCNDVNHIDGKKLNNKSINLEWCTRSHNMKHAYKIGLSKPTDKNGRKIRIIETGDVFPSISACARDLDTKEKNICMCLNPNKKYNRSAHKGFHFEYVDNDEVSKKPQNDILRDYQLGAIDRMTNGCILNGGVGSGKSRTGIYYYFKENGGSYTNRKYVRMDDPQDLYIITTARKRETYEWSGELSLFRLSIHSEASLYNNKVVVDSWNNIKKYAEVKNAFFIFDEQKVLGSGAWVKAFLKIVKSNNWILLSATAGDCWNDYVPVFIANGFYKNRTQFNEEHVVFKRFSKFPQIDKYINTNRLIRLRNKILVDMDFERKTISHHIDIFCDYPKMKYSDVRKNRWNPYKNEPIVNAAELCYTERKVVNSDVSRLNEVIDLFDKHRRVIVFYNFDYELEILKQLSSLGDLPSIGNKGFELAEWNGHKHQEIPNTPEWIYLVQYNAGAEGWNCIKTDTIIFYSQNYSYKIEEQARGRIDRLNTPYTDLYYYHLKSKSKIDLAILQNKKNFNEGKYVSKFK